MEEWPYSANGVSKTGRIPHRITEELETGHKVNRRGTEEHKKTVLQEEKKLSRIKG